MIYYWLPIFKKNLFFSLPWNQTTFYGYCGELGLVATDTTGFMLVNGGLLLLFISICMHHRAFSNIFKNAIAKSNKSIGVTNAKQCNARFLHDLIEFHISAKKYVKFSMKFWKFC